MEIIFILLPASVFLAFLGLLGFRWSIRNDQFDDLDTPQIRMLYDDETRGEKGETESYNK